MVAGNKLHLVLLFCRAWVYSQLNWIIIRFCRDNGNEVYHKIWNPYQTTWTRKAQGISTSFECLKKPFQHYSFQSAVRCPKFHGTYKMCYKTGRYKNFQNNWTTVKHCTINKIRRYILVHPTYWKILLDQLGLKILFAIYKSYCNNYWSSGAICNERSSLDSQYTFMARTENVAHYLHLNVDDLEEPNSLRETATKMIFFIAWTHLKSFK